MPLGAAVVAGFYLIDENVFFVFLSTAQPAGFMLRVQVLRRWIPWRGLIHQTGRGRGGGRAGAVQQQKQDELVHGAAFRLRLFL
jgi:hypothetical protein